MIEFDGVSKFYPGNALSKTSGNTPVGTTAVDNVSFTVTKGSTTVLLGPSGSGKSTLLSMVNRMIDPTKGRVLVNGKDIATINAVHLRRSIGYVMQSGGLLPHRTVVDNIATVPRLKGQLKAQTHAHALELLDLVGLDRSLAKRYPAQLSGGQQQRVGVARALATDAEILLMDEPFSAVDPIMRKELQQQVRGLQQDLGKTILFVTHDIDEAFALADTIIILRPGGTIAQVGSATQILTHPADNFIRNFIGVGSGERCLKIISEADRTLVVDAYGKPLGIVEP